MNTLRRFFALLVVILIALTTRAQQYSKADQALIANYSLTIDQVSKYMDFEKGFSAAKASEPKYKSMTPSNTLDGKINEFSTMPSFVNLAKKVGTNLRDITLTGSSLHMLFLATDPKKQDMFKKYCDMGYVLPPSKEQMAFAEGHRSQMTQWQKQIIEYGQAK